MKKMLFLIAMFVFGAQAISAQESNNGKDIWAISYLNKTAPEIKVEQWLSEEPELEGKFILLEFWATWCGPCRKAIPKLNAWHKTFADDMVVMCLSDEKAEKVSLMVNPVIEYYNAIDTRALTKTEVGVQGVPHAMLISPDKTVIWEGFPLLGGHELTEEVIAALIEKYKK
ncbi:MAG: TlpA disulfide reductase family protein [Rikenellaceae bacterium]